MNSPSVPSVADVGKRQFCVVNIAEQTSIKNGQNEGVPEKPPISRICNRGVA